MATSLGVAWPGCDKPRRRSGGAALAEWFIHARLVPRGKWARAVQRTVLHRIARGSAQGHSHCADHKPLDPEPSQPSVCHKGQDLNAKHAGPRRARQRVGMGPAPGRPPWLCPLGAALGRWLEKRLHAMRGGGRGSLRGSDGGRRNARTGRSFQARRRGRAGRGGHGRGRSVQADHGRGRGGPGQSRPGSTVRADHGGDKAAVTDTAGGRGAQFAGEPAQEFLLGEERGGTARALRAGVNVPGWGRDGMPGGRGRAEKSSCEWLQASINAVQFKPKKE